METTPAPGWYADPTMPQTQRYWDGRAWTEHVAPAAPPAHDNGPGTAMHWVVPVGRSWQSVTAGYLALVCLLFAFFGPLGIVTGGVTLWLGLWALRLAGDGGHGRGRAIFGIVGGSFAVIVGIITTAVMFFL